MREPERRMEDHFPDDVIKVIEIYGELIVVTKRQAFRLVRGAFRLIDIQLQAANAPTPT
jgi:hypothetical protein